jgi:hypothetical protein
MEVIKKNKVTVILIVFLFLIFAGGIFAYQKFLAAPPVPQGDLADQELTFDPEGPYIVMTPRADGNAVTVSIKRIASYDQFAYTISYADDQGIPRGAGDENTWITLEKGKGEYDQEILFGTCSKNVCKYDQGVENGTLVLRIKKGNQPYRMTSTWHLQNVSLAEGKLVSGDNHMFYTIDKKDVDPTNAGFSVINELTGAPKIPSGRQVMGKVYSLTTAFTKVLPKGHVKIELADNPPSDAKIARFDESKSDWVQLDAKVNGSTLEADAESGGIITVLVPKN